MKRSLHVSTEFQIPPVIQKYANFMFSFIGRGVCKYSTRNFKVDIYVATPCLLYTNLIVYIFAGSILLHGSVLRYIAGTIIGVVGLAYCESDLNLIVFVGQPR